MITPLFADQPDNARRVAEVGAGVAVQPADRAAVTSAIDPSDLRRAIVNVLDDARYLGAARRMAEEIGGLPPVDEAVAVIATQ